MPKHTASARVARRSSGWVQPVRSSRASRQASTLRAGHLHHRVEAERQQAEGAGGDAG